MRFVQLFTIGLLFFSCNLKKVGDIYRAELIINDSLSIPFFIHYYSSTSSYVIVNADEEITPLVSIDNDSISLEHQVFNSELRFVHRGDSLLGVWYNKEKGNYKMPFRAVRSEHRFTTQQSQIELPRKWRYTIDEGDDEYPAIGIFEQSAQEIRGTILTETGDYRFLEGVLSNDSLLISTFDFAHAFVFKARIINNEMKGVFYSGNHWKAPFRAVVDPNAELGDPQELVEVLDSIGYDFTLTGLSGEVIRIDHALFQNKAIVLQIFGSWCPNCYDESVFLNSIYSDLPKNKIEFIGVAFERSPNFSSAKQKIEKFRSGLAIKYPLAYGGTSNKDSAQLVFPFLKEVLSFPTLLYYNKDHELVGIHTGFSGPGTGDEYLKTRNEINKSIKSLIQE